MVNVVFRVDASVQIGTGHVMRCVVLANELATLGARCRFLMRDLPGHLAEWVTQNGHVVSLLTSAATDGLADASATRSLLDAEAPDWVIVDHYGLDARWEKIVQPSTRFMMAIDDLADREHHCEALLDQNAGRTQSDYAHLLSKDAHRMLGPQYALMAPVFRELRSRSLTRRTRPQQGARLLISMGGVDQTNITERVLEWVAALIDAAPTAIDVVLGPHAPHLDRIRVRVANMRVPTLLHVNTRSMGELLSNADIAIGAGGISALERCVVGLPAIVVSAADNQIPGSTALDCQGAALYIGTAHDFEQRLSQAWERFQDLGYRAIASRQASGVCDGAGAQRVARHLIERLA